MPQGDHIKFRNGPDTLTLWVEKEIDDGFEVIGIVGWCPELKGNVVVHPENVVREEVKS